MPGRRRARVGGRGLEATIEVRVVESNDGSSVILDAVCNDLVELIAMITREREYSLGDRHR